MASKEQTRRGPGRVALEKFGTTIFTEMSRLAIEHQAVNLGQGFPDFPGPQFLKDAACEAIRADCNQYARMAGVLELVKAIATKVETWTGLQYDPMDEVTVYSGCTEAICSTLLALCDAGDEVVLLQPYYDCYHAAVVMAGATPRFVTLHAPEFRWNEDELAAAFGPRTRAILLNTPQNPTGRVFDRSEMETVARLAQQHDVVVIADEVYEHLVYEGEHIPMATLPGMRERTVSLNSTGKTFSMTGWKIGYSTAPAPLTRALRTAHQFVTFATATPLQHAMVAAMRAPHSYYARLLEEYRVRRDRLVAALDAAGLDVFPCQGTYFVCAGFGSLGFEDDVEFCKHLIEKVGVVAIPPSAFYEDKRLGRSYARFAFCKTEATLAEAARRLKQLRPRS